MSQLRFTLSNAVAATATVLGTDPLNWDSLDFTLKRNEELGGIFRSYSADIEFHSDGYTYVRNIYETQGVEAVILVLVEQLDNEDFTYKTIFSGRLNLNNYAEILDENCVEIIQTNIEEISFNERFLNNLDVEVNLYSLITKTGQDITPYASEDQEINISSVLIPKAYEANNQADTLFQGLYQWWHENITYNLYGQVNFDDIVTENINGVFEYGTLLSDVRPDNDRKFFLKVEDAGDYEIDQSIDIDIDTEVVGNSDEYDNFDVQAFLYKNGVQVDAGPIVSDNNNDNISLNYTWTFNYVDSLDIGDELFFWIRIQFDVDPGLLDRKSEVKDFNFSVNSASREISAVTSFPTSQVNAMLNYEAFNRIVESVTDVPNAIRSDFYGRTDSEPMTYVADGDGSLEANTNGYLLRAFTKDERGLFMTFLDLFKNEKVKHNIGAGIIEEGGMDVLRIEPLEYFYQDVTLFDVGEGLSEFSKEVAADLYTQRVKIGYTIWQPESDEVAGLDEYNSIREFILPINSTMEEMDLMSDFVTGGYLIELKRREIRNSGISENEEPNLKYDESNFSVKLVRTGGSPEYENETNEDLVSATNIGDDVNLVNIKFAPARVLRAHLNVLAASLYLNADKTIRFASGQGNYKATSELTGEPDINEQGDIFFSELPDPLWLPEIYKFSSPLTFANIQAINANPYGKITFINPITKLPASGFIRELDWNGETRVANWQLLRSGESLNPPVLECLEDELEDCLLDETGAELYDEEQNI